MSLRSVGSDWNGLRSFRLPEAAGDALDNQHGKAGERDIEQGNQQGGVEPEQQALAQDERGEGEAVAQRIGENIEGFALGGGLDSELPQQGAGGAVD